MARYNYIAVVHYSIVAIALEGLMNMIWCDMVWHYQVSAVHHRRMV